MHADYEIIGARRRQPVADDLPLFAPPIARTADPETSHAAAAKLTTRAAYVLAVVRAHLEAGEALGLTADECADRTGIAGAWKRCSDAVALGYLVDTGRTRPGASGRGQAVRCITPAGRAFVAQHTERA